MLFEIKPSVTYTFSGLIWKLELDSASDLLYVETRNQQEHLVSFSAFDLKNGQANFIEITSEEKWLAGMNGGRKGVLFLYGYKSVQSPEQKGIIAIDGLTGKQLWADYNLALEKFTAEGLLATDQRFQTKKMILLDEQTGAVKDVAKNSIFPDDLQEIAYPLMLRLLPENLRQLLSVTITGEISCLNYNSYLIISLHSQNNKNLVQELYVIKEEKVVYHDLLNEHIQKLQPEAFVLIKNHLIYIKNKITLKVLNL